MRRIMIFLAVIAFVSSLCAADRTVGTWKLNLAKSKMAPSAEAPTKELTIVKREINPDEVEITETGTRTDGSRISMKFTHPSKGGIVKNQDAPQGQISVATVIGSAELYETILQDGKQVELIHIVISEDGKTMRNTITGIDEKDQPYQGINVFDKQ